MILYSRNRALVGRKRPLVERSAGGSGRTRLTAFGERVVSLLRDREAEFHGLLAAMGGNGQFDRFFRYFQLVRRFSVKTSARNQYLGHVTSVTRGAVNSEVILDIGGGDSLAAIITNESIHGLGLAVGVRACALIKASHIILAVNA